ncbi:type II toxin-antitoxin system CcdA family antitoxin [Geomonas oryzisoli]|uniref:Type II toxin-antitoxin system CcdA family antitoxin n=1 Tax=Geomonas oryzisoli TaxID=2847992 RepID=A0ABX8JBV0_9BACT|nr:type II toxin-antitoxin system CcdA family antitoxin [Geomonas oryzisoli]QWV94164.1 type II toxin-antitoxin system CcdA family antitoxin [Geomonas oryzisoli]
MPVNLFGPNAPQKLITVREDYYLHWNEENKEAIDDYNRRVDTQGTFSDGRRRF